MVTDYTLSHCLAIPDEILNMATYNISSNNPITVDFAVIFMLWNDFLHLLNVFFSLAHLPFS